VTASERTSPYDRRRDVADKPISEARKQSSGAMGPDSSTDEAMVRQHLKEQLRQLKKLNSAAASIDKNLGGC
jgi:hypothetical protein